MKQLSHASVFLAQFLRHPLRVGSLVPSSSLLARSLIPDAILAEAQLIVELGPGTGVVTGELIRAKPNTCRYLGIELNRSFVRLLQERFPREQFHHGDAAALSDILRAYGHGKADIIVSSIPLTNLSERRALSSIDIFASCLEDGGAFTTYIYCHNLLLARNRRTLGALRSLFARTELSVVIVNFPPAVVIKCYRPRSG